MSTIEWLALGLIVIVIVETVIWTLWPDLILSLADYLYDHPWLNNLIHGVGALGVLAVLLNHVTPVEILSTTLFVALLSGMIATPFGSRGVTVVRETMDKDRVWPHMVGPWLIMMTLVVLTIREIAV
jgi:hypothetical protein